MLPVQPGTKRRNRTPWPWANLILLSLGATAMHAPGAGVTVITHGFGSDVNGWITAMANWIPKYSAFPGTNFTIYTVTLTTDGAGNYFYQWQRPNGSAPATTDSGEIIVKLDWSQMAGFSTYDLSTYTVATIASYVLLQTNAIGDLGGHALAEFPLHLIGHSRGGSLISEISRRLGTNGVWIDHLTTLDPHPVNNDGFYDPLAPVTDAPVHTYANVLFHDNYWENLNQYPWGESVAGAYSRPLNSNLSVNPSAGYGDYHSNVHLWYYGTIDERTPATYSYAGDSATIDATLRSVWWVGYENRGPRAGFLYSLIGGGNRLSTDQPLGPGYSAIRDGYNQAWDLGAGVANNRTALPTNNAAWPSLIRCNRTDTNSVVQGQSVGVKLYYQWAAPATRNAVIAFYADNDLNPLNGNEVLLSQITVSGTGPAGVNPTTVFIPLNATNVPPGRHTLFARISANGQARLLYAPEWVQVVAGGQPPTLDISGLAASALRIRLNGLPGQTVILQTSSNLASWRSVATNTLSGLTLFYTNTPAVRTGQQFYRAQLAP